MGLVVAACRFRAPRTRRVQVSLGLDLVAVAFLLGMYLSARIIVEAAASVDYFLVLIFGVHMWVCCRVLFPYMVLVRGPSSIYRHSCPSSSS